MTTKASVICPTGKPKDDEYRQKRRELDAHYKRLGLDIETISKKRPVFA